MAQLQSLAYAPGTLREYETIYILKPGTAGDAVADVNERVKGIVESGGGKVIKVDNWGKRRLAYEIKKELKGVYLYWQYLGSPAIVAEFERNLRMLDPVIRYMTVRLDENIDPEARPTEVDDETYERAATTASDEEDEILASRDHDRDRDRDRDRDDDDDDDHVHARGHAHDDDDDDNDNDNDEDKNNDDDEAPASDEES